MGVSGTLDSIARAVGNLQDAVLITEGERGADGVRRIIFVNRAFTEMTGYAREEAIGSLPDITIGPESDRDVLRLIQSARDALVPVRVELLKYRKDGSTFWAELDVVPVLDDARRCSHFLGVMRDVSERRAAQRLLETQQRSSEGTLARELSHPLSSMRMNIGRLREELPALIATSDDPSRWEKLERALDAIHRSAAEVTQILSGVGADRDRDA